MYECVYKGTTNNNLGVGKSKNNNFFSGKAQCAYAIPESDRAYSQFANGDSGLKIRQLLAELQQLKCLSPFSLERERERERGCALIGINMVFVPKEGLFIFFPRRPLEIFTWGKSSIFGHSLFSRHTPRS